MKIQNKTLLYLTVSAILLLTVSCIGTKGTGKASKYVETFYVEGGHTQYFVKPVQYKSENDSELFVDFTLCDSIKQPPVRMMFTLATENILQGHKSCKIGVRRDQMHEAKIIFAEPVKKGYNYRYEAYIPFNDFVLIAREKEDIALSIGQTGLLFKPVKKTEKSLDHVEHAVIYMMEMQ